MSMPSNSNPQPASAAQPADPSPVQPLRARAAVDLAPKESDDSFVGMTGGEIFHEMMLRKGVDVVFGYPGGAILP
ncbi:Acetolactate synthase, mitochondrial, partial [Spiromyces aspiralis]